VIIASGNDLLVSRRFRQVYEQERLQGLQGFDPIEIVSIKRRRKTLEDPPEYYRVNTVWSRTRVDPTASGVEWDNKEPICPECLEDGLVKGWNGVVIPPRLWSGEDIFRPRGVPGVIVTSQRFHAVCQANDIKNAFLLPAESYSYRC
jgi:hypothetical protein